MRKFGSRLTLGTLAVLLAGCMHRSSLYASWGQTLQDLPLRNGTPDDVSMMVGSPPTRCDPVASQGAKAGVLMRGDSPIVRVVFPKGPAASAGIRVGDTILRVGQEPVATGPQALAALSATAQEGNPLVLQTSRGTVEVVPRVPRLEQCYWEIQAGGVAQHGAYVTQYGGVSGGSAYQRFFRASCRIWDGYVANCQSNWQE
jgi:hypothetical protein